MTTAHPARPFRISVTFPAGRRSMVSPAILRFTSAADAEIVAACYRRTYPTHIYEVVAVDSLGNIIPTSQEPTP